MTRHAHRWEYFQRQQFLGLVNGEYLVTVAKCKCGAVLGYRPDATHPKAAEIGLTLEETGDGFLPSAARCWLEARREALK